MERKEKYGFGMWKNVPLALIQPVYIVVANDVISFCRTKEEAFAILDKIDQMDRRQNSQSMR